MKPVKRHANEGRSMAITHDYVDYLDEQIDIAPAGSQEELQAAQTIAEEMKLHGLEATIEEFDAKSIKSLGYSIYLILLFIGVIFAGTGNAALIAFGVLLVAGFGALTCLKYFGNDILGSFGSSIRSQNVVAKHEATGELVAKGNRPIVIVAHYDSPHTNFLVESPVAKYVPLAQRYARWCVVAVFVATFVQILRFLPDPVRVLFWIVGILTALPLVVLSVATIAERFAPCTIGANNNKSSVAALLGILENVRPTGHRPEVVHHFAGDAAALIPEPDEVEGVRHGEEVLNSLGILPEDCEVSYVAYDTTGASQTASLEDVAEAVNATTEDNQAEDAADNTVAYDSVDDELNATMKQVHESADADATQVQPEATHELHAKNDFARRASLFDLPDPSGDAVDPLAPSSEPAPHYVPTQAPAPTPEAEDAESPFDTISADEGLTEAQDAKTPEAKRRSFRLFGRNDGPSDDWKGGAAPSAENREETDSEDAAAISEDDLRNAVLSLSDDELIAHDIWFVALGASDFDHAGMREFLSKHRTDIRGAFLINLDCVGAGSLSILKNEGIGNVRRADRRMTRLLSTIATDLHIDVEQSAFDWGTTDATPAMQNSVRSVTLMGLNEDGLPALSRTAADVRENVNAGQCADAAALVTELIRRS